MTDIWLDGLRGSAPAVALASLTARSTPVVRPFLVVPNDEEEAGYMYHDLQQMLGEERVLFYPSAYRRAAKYGQRDAANEILRTEVLGRLAQWGRAGQERASLYVVSFPQALCERVAAPEQVQEAAPEPEPEQQHYTTNHDAAQQEAQRAATQRDTREQPRQPMVKDKLPGRNDPCPCGSGRKFKDCHGRRI